MDGLYGMEHPPSRQERPQKPLTRPYVSSSSRVVLNFATVFAIIAGTASAAYAYAVTSSSTTHTAAKVDKLEQMAVDHGVDIEKLKLQREHEEQMRQAFEKRLSLFESKLEDQHTQVMILLRDLQRARDRERERESR